MADNVPITAGSGTTIATDDVSTVHYQKVKLVDGTADSTAAIAGDATNGLDVDVTRVSGVVDVTPASPAASDYLPVRLTDGSAFVAPGGTHVDDAAFAPGTDDGVPVMGTYRSTRDSVDDNDAGVIAMTAKRGVFVVPETPNGDLCVDDTADALKVSQATAANLNAQVVGSIASGASDSGNPVKIGFMADSTYITAVTDGQRVDGVADLYGVQRVRTDHPRLWSMHYDGSSAQTDLSVQGAPGSGLSVYITDIVVSTGAATALNVFFEEGSTKILGPYYLEAVAGRGLAIHFTTPKKCTANTAVTVTTSAAIAQCIDVLGFIAP
jgi:hypothetical protein